MVGWEIGRVGGGWNYSGGRTKTWIHGGQWGWSDETLWAVSRGEMGALMREGLMVYWGL